MNKAEKTVVFWGAGATASLGMPTTSRQADLVCTLAAVDENSSGTTLRERVGQALKDIGDETWVSAFCDLLIVLGDGKQGEAHPGTVTPKQMDAMRRNSTATDEQIRSRIVRLRILYDWPALRDVIAACPKGEDSIVDLRDLFNILDMHGRSGHGFRVGSRNPTDDFLTPDRVRGARDALKLVLQAMFYVSWQHCRRNRSVDLQHHYEFAKMLGKRMQRQGRELAQRDVDFDDREFYLGDVAFASMNYDPIALWMQYIANRDLNKMPTVPHVGSPALKLQLFHDLGHFVGGHRIEGTKKRQHPFYPMNESVAQRLNDPDHGANGRIRITKFLFPHGCLWWRECPNCGKLSSQMGDEWQIDSPTLVPPPPLKAFVGPPDTFRHRDEKEEKAWKEGRVDARACVHCGTLTSAHDTQLIMQSNFKGPPPPSIGEIERDLRVVVQNADHIVFMGYSLPPDDVEYRAFFAARRQRANLRSVKCSVVVGQSKSCRSWQPFSKVKRSDIGNSEYGTLTAACQIFGEKNVRFYGGGIPDVFFENGQVTMPAVERLLSWEKRP